MNYFMKALQVMGIIAAWSAQALTDGKITAAEGFDLLSQLAVVLKLPLEFEVGALQAQAPAQLQARPAEGQGA